MAKIPVEEERSGGGWWKWLLGLAAIVLAVWLIWEIASPDEQDDFAIGDEMEQREGTDAMGAGLITDASTILQAQDQGQLVGREVHLTNMRVERVQGDSLLFVTSDQTMQTPRGDGFETEPGQGTESPQDDGMQTPRDQGMQDDGMQTQPDEGMQQPRDGTQMMNGDESIIVAGIDQATMQDGPQGTSPQGDSPQNDNPQGDSPQGETEFEEGQMVTVIGSIERMQQNQPGSWGITAQEGEQMMEENEIYVRARRLQVTDGMEVRPQPTSGL